MAQVLAKILRFVKCSLFARTEGKTISLHDVDKGNDDRGNPSPNTHDVVAEGANMAHRTVSTSYSTATGAPGARIQMSNNQVNAYDANNLLVSTYGIQADGSINLKFFDTAGVGTAQFGRYADGTTKLKIAKSGKEVSTAADSDLIFNSGQDVFKIAATLTQGFTFTSGGSVPGATTVTITHDLGYVPVIQPTVTITTLTNGTTGIYPIPFFTPGTGGGTTNVFILLSYIRVSSVTTSTITFEVGIQAPTQTFAGTITCYVLQETAT